MFLVLYIRVPFLFNQPKKNHGMLGRVFGATDHNGFRCFTRIADRRERGTELLEYLTFEATDSVQITFSIEPKNCESVNIMIT